MSIANRFAEQFVTFSIDKNGKAGLAIGNGYVPTYDQMKAVKHLLNSELKDKSEYDKERQKMYDEISSSYGRGSYEPEEPKVSITNIYLVHDTDNNFLKIGRSKNPKSRVKSLQISTAYNLELLDVIENVEHTLESELHELFSHLRVNGEWFEYSEDIINEFKRLGNE